MSKSSNRDHFKLVSDFELRGDQERAICELCSGLDRGDRHQVLLGVTGSGKTFTMAHVVATVNRPTLVMVHNKTLAAQLAVHLNLQYYRLRSETETESECRSSGEWRVGEW